MVAAEAPAAVVSVQLPGFLLCGNMKGPPVPRRRLLALPPLPPLPPVPVEPPVPPVPVVPPAPLPLSPPVPGSLLLGNADAQPIIDDADADATATSAAARRGERI